MKVNLLCKVGSSDEGLSLTMRDVLARKCKHVIILIPGGHEAYAVT